MKIENCLPGQGAFKNRRKSRSRLPVRRTQTGRGNEAELFFTRKSASYSENELRGKVRPHPGPLPQERGKPAQRPEIFTFSGVAPSHEDLRRRLPFLNSSWGDVERAEKGEAPKGTTVS